MTFVDDDCLILMAPTPGILDRGIAVLLELLLLTFNAMDLKINWAKGKTECMVQYRGKGATQHRMQWKTDDGYKIRLPGKCDHTDGVRRRIMRKRQAADKHYLLIVSNYKHLGVHICIDGSDVQDARHKEAQAMMSFAPIATKVLGSRDIGLCLKNIFLEALVLSRLLFNTHVRAPSVAFMKSLNMIYMRALRRIAGKMRYDHTAGTDLHARQALCAPSIDCLLRRKRLLYLRRLIVDGPAVLQALLAVDAPLDPLPWTKLVIADLDSVAVLLGRAVLQRPETNHAEWNHYLTNVGEKWNSVVNR